MGGERQARVDFKWFEARTRCAAQCAAQRAVSHSAAQQCRTGCALAARFLARFLNLGLFELVFARSGQPCVLPFLGLTVWQDFKVRFIRAFAGAQGGLGWMHTPRASGQFEQDAHTGHSGAARRNALLRRPLAARSWERALVVAVAVSAIIGTPGSFDRSAPKVRKSLRKSCPHSDTQCASSMATCRDALWVV